MKNNEKLSDAVSAFETFKNLYPELYSSVVNGAGPAKYGNAVRDTWFLGFSVTDAANVHDYLYSKYCDGKRFSRKDADDIFLELMQQKLSQQSLMSRALNTPIIYAIWSSVRLCGALFWKK